MPLYMLDTDTVSYLVRGKTPALDAHVATVSPKHLCISAVTRGELLYGLKLKGVEGIYNGHDYFNERKVALEVWGQLLVQLKQGESAKVIPIAASRRVAA